MGNLVREKIHRTNNFKQAGERYRIFENWERDDLILNLVNTLKPCRKDIQDKMVELFTKCDPDYGTRVAEGLRKAADQAGQRGPIGSSSSEYAVRDAKKKSHNGKPY